MAWALSACRGCPCHSSQRSGVADVCLQGVVYQIWNAWLQGIARKERKLEMQDEDGIEDGVLL